MGKLIPRICDIKEVLFPSNCAVAYKCLQLKLILLETSQMFDAQIAKYTGSP